MPSSSIPSIAGMLFRGEWNESLVFPFPMMSSDRVEIVQEMVAAVQKFGESVDSVRMDEQGAIPAETMQLMIELGFFGLAMAEEYGGLGLDASMYARVISALAEIDNAITITIGAHQGIGCRALMLFGTEEQKKAWLPRLASGEIIAAFCLTEAGAGSDAKAIQTRAVRNDDGSFTITGEKLWITNAGMASFYTVFAKTEHEENGQKKERMSCFIVEGNRPGVSVGEKEKKMGIRASETRGVFFDHVCVPPENVVGELGQGFKMALTILNSGRFALGSGSVGAMRTAIRRSVVHATERKQFGKSISEYGIIQEKLVRMASLCYATECATYMTSGRMDQGLKDYAIETAIIKVFATEALWSCVDQAMQIAGGAGYMQEYPYERMMRDGRINMIFEGTNEILRLFIALSGIRGPADDLKDFRNLSHPSQIWKAFRRSASKAVRQQVPRQFTQLHPDLAREGRQWMKMASVFAWEVEEALFRHKRSIVHRELVLKRLAEMAIDLYVSLCVLSRTTAILSSSALPEEDRVYAAQLGRIFVHDAKRRFADHQRQMKHHDDELIASASRHLCEKGKHPLDVMYA